MEQDAGGDSSQLPSPSEDSEASYDSDGRRKSKKKSAKKRPVIPGERKSSRSRKGTNMMVGILKFVCKCIGF